MKIKNEFNLKGTNLSFTTEEETTFNGIVESSHTVGGAIYKERINKIAQELKEIAEDVADFKLNPRKVRYIGEKEYHLFFFMDDDQQLVLRRGDIVEGIIDGNGGYLKFSHAGHTDTAPAEFFQLVVDKLDVKIEELKNQIDAERLFRCDEYITNLEFGKSRSREHRLKEELKVLRDKKKRKLED